MQDGGSGATRIRTGWLGWLPRLALSALLFELLTGLVVTVGPLHPAVEWTVLVHTLVGAVTLVPIAWYLSAHWVDDRGYSFYHVVLLGYVAGGALVICLLSGVVVTCQALFSTRTSYWWRQAHVVSTLVTLGATLPHVLFAAVRSWREPRASRRPAWRAARACLAQAASHTVAGAALIGGLTVLYSGTAYLNEFPDDYEFLYGEDRPFAPSLARTSTGGAFDPRSLAGSETCGSAGCHTEIVQEWKPSAHRSAAMDTLFQGIQTVMAEQNGPESTRYCGGCHDPISLFSGTKNIFVDDLTGLRGFNEGISCLACHSIQETDIQGNANYTVRQPEEYLWQWSEGGAGRLARDFLIRSYPAKHNLLSKRMFKSPEYCAACHKQFIDEEVNRVGWVQLQNQYDNWAASHWNQEGDPQRTIECRECHMPLVESTDPAAGDDADYNRTAADGKHRSHRFLASNQLMPKLLELEGWQEQVESIERWLRGEYEIPEISDKWPAGPIVRVALEVPETIAVGEQIPVRVVFTANKVGHDYPTGPLDIIQSWLELRVTDDAGQVIFSTGRRDDRQFIEPGTFMFKAEPLISTATSSTATICGRWSACDSGGPSFRATPIPWSTW